MSVAGRPDAGAGRPAPVGPEEVGGADVTGITVVTLTRRRPVLVQRAMHSVRAQVTRHAVHHVILVDDCEETWETLRGQACGPGVEVLWMLREPHEVSGPGRSSRMRNFAVRRSTDPWVAFLDDDNEWAPDHLERLVDCAQGHRVRAAHSYVALVHRDGRPYVDPVWPWARSPEEARRIYRDYVVKGIVVPGSNVVRDRPGHIDEPVDTSAWLLARELLLEVPFEERFTAADAENLVGEDDKLFHALVGRGERFESTRVPTLTYYLGGYSNDSRGLTDETFSWEG